MTGSAHHPRIGESPLPALPEKSNRALKEWAAVEQVLAAGEVSLLLRKGGLWERREGFEMEHRQFWLFPTLYHQNPEELKADFGWALESVREAHSDVNRVRLESFAVVSSAFRVEELDTLQEISRWQALTEEAIEARFHYRNRPYLHALLLRVYRVPGAHILANTLGYEGCVSWVELDEEISTHGASPVLDDEQFAAVNEELLGRLHGRCGVVPA